MKQIWLILAITTLVLTACGSEAEPTISAAEVQGTAVAAALTMVAETQAVIPTATLLPPTEAPSATPFPTNTVAPLVLTSPTQAQALAVVPTNTPVPASGSGNDPCNQPLTTWEGESAQMRLQNNTKPKGVVTASLFFRTSLGQCGYIGTQFSGTTTLTVPVGTFSAGAFVDGPKDFKIFGGGTITRPGNYSLWFENEAIILKAGCAPNC